MKILVVDDSKTMRYVLTTALKEIGYTNIITADCVDRAKSLATIEPLPDLIFSDWNMPGATGLDLLKFIRSNPRTIETPFIMLTTETDRAKIVEATRAGLQSYILKPVKKSVLIEKMTELSTAYGFEPPNSEGDGKNTSKVVTTETGELKKHPLKGLLKSEQIESIVDAYSRILNGESTKREFEELIVKELFGDSREEKLEDVELFMQTIQECVLCAVEQKLTQFVE